MNQRLIVCAIASAFLLGGLSACSKSASNTNDEVTSPASALTVEVVALRAEVWPQMVQTSGQLMAWQEIVVTPETGGLQLVELAVDVGAKVKRGDLIARLSDESLRNDLRRQEALVAQAKASHELALSNLQRARLTEGSGALSEQRIEEYRITADTSRASLESAKAELDSIKLKLSHTRILAIDDGIVSSKSAVLGNVVGTGTELYRLVRQGRVEWRPEIDAHFLEAVKPGRVAHVTLPNGQVVSGEVRTVGPTLSSTTGRATVYVKLPTGSSARPGMFGSGTIELSNKPAMTLPATAVVMRDGRAYVYLVEKEGKATSRPVVTGRRLKDRVEIVGDLPVGARVVASGGAFLSEGAPVTVAASSTAPSGGNKEGR